MQMQIPEFTLVGFLTVYVVQGLVFAYFLFVGIRIIRRGAKRLNLILSGFFFSCSIGLFINFIFVLIFEEIIVLILYYLTLFFIFLSPVFALLFNMVLMNKIDIKDTKKQLSIILIYSIIVICMVLIPRGVIINETTGWIPIWNPYLFFYLIVVVSCFTIFPSLYLSVLAYTRFTDTTLKSKFRFYIIGLCFIYFLMYSIMLSNFLDHPVVRNLIGLFGVIFSFIGGSLIYFGIGRIN
ncbi:MAG: hypothetical protein GF383_01730 [Candidatus Lokiarchaeota archaeon]|nr:hypothetical protein [Candidatus Lokiarchaeota archaeon]MBD3338027.1 hypothetical protein [Candidatus Lokiarchaeota archaeon]